MMEKMRRPKKMMSHVMEKIKSHMIQNQ